MGLGFTRRELFQSMPGGIYGAALASLFGMETARSSNVPTNSKPRQAHFPAKAKSVIHLFMNGGPSQMDLFDPKPMLDKHHGKPYFDKIAGEVEFIQRRRRAHAQPVQVRPARPVRHVGLRRDAAPGRHGRRPRLHPLDVHDEPDARAGAST